MEIYCQRSTKCYEVISWELYVDFICSLFNDVFMSNSRQYRRIKRQDVDDKLKRIWNEVVVS
jgi:hypothetical protein